MPSSLNNNRCFPVKPQGDFTVLFVAARQAPADVRGKRVESGKYKSASTRYFSDTAEAAPTTIGRVGSAIHSLQDPA